MKRKVMLCVLVFALLLTCANAMAAKIGNAVSESASGATITEQDDQSFKVTYTGQKDKEYVVMVVSEDGVSDGNVPTKESIGNNQDGVVVYMDQVTGQSDGTVEFVVRPNLETSKKGAKYYVCMSSNEASGNTMKTLGSFTIEDLIRYLGDMNGDEDITIADVQILLNYVIDNARLTGDDLTAANVNKDEAKDINIGDVQLLLNRVIDNAPKEAI